ncbi:MAG: hypothetical protein QXO51_05440 [Halobacteria archaeon]
MVTSAETKIVAGFNRFFRERGIDGVAYRIRQHRFAPQVVDLLVDSRHWRYYLAMEVKSISLEKGTRSLYFSQHFHQARKGEENQVGRISDFLRLSGRIGFLAVEMRRGVGRPLECHLVPWRAVETRFRQGQSGFRVEELMAFPQVPQAGRDYAFTEEFLAEAVEGPGAAPAPVVQVREVRVVS